jgi:L-proline amide hydrolase
MAKAAEGYMPFGSFCTYWRVVGEKTGKPPLLTLHGGPGAAHDYLTSLDDLAQNGRQVIYYDQCGCGRSPAPPDPGRWTPRLFLEELKALHRHLNLDRFHLLGQSWGGMLAICFAGAKPKGLAGLVLASSPVSVAQWNKESDRLLAGMPDGPRYALEQGEATGIRDTREYREALLQFNARHICRMKTVPKFVLRSLSQIGEVFYTMRGKSGLKMGGILEDVDLTSHLPDIEAPTLVTAGKYDQCTPIIVQTLLDGIADSRSMILKKSGHLAHAEERETFNNAIESFLSEVETKMARRVFPPASR